MSNLFYFTIHFNPINNKFVLYINDVTLNSYEVFQYECKYDLLDKLKFYLDFLEESKCQDIQISINMEDFYE